MITADAKLKVTATHRQTKKEHEKIMTYGEWVVLEKSYKFDWKAVQV